RRSRIRRTPGAAAPSSTGPGAWARARATTSPSKPSCRSPPSWTASMAAKRMPRVLMTADTVGGVWTYAVELAHELEARGIRVAIATMGAPLSRHQRTEIATSRRITLFESEYRLEWMQDCIADVEAAGEWLLQLERDFEPDIVHLNQYAFGALPFAAPTLMVAHSCVLSWFQA